MAVFSIIFNRFTFEWKHIQRQVSGSENRLL